MVVENITQHELRIGGFLPFTTIDFPTVSAACVVFCQGCPWRCPYCQNYMLQPINGTGLLPWPDVLGQIIERRGFLDGVVFSGGEPLAQPAVRDAALEVKALGFKVALHTSGSLPERLKALLPIVDWVGLDIKAPFALYDSITNSTGSGERAKESLQMLLASGVDLECRTTIDPELLSEADVLQLARDVRACGAEALVLQPCFDDERRRKPSSCFSPTALENLRAILPGLVVRD